MTNNPEKDLPGAEGKKKSQGAVLRTIFLGKRYSELISIDDQARYMTMNAIFMVVMFPLLILGITLIRVDPVRTGIDFGIAFLCLASLLLMRSKIPLRIIPLVPVTVFGLYCLYLLYTGTLYLWVTVWIFAFPLVVVFLCQITIGVIQSVISLAGVILLMYIPLMPNPPINEIRMRFVAGYVLIIALTIIYERVSILKTRKEESLNAQLAHERDVIQSMKDNIHQGIFLMDGEFKILPQYSRPLISILSYYDSELAGKSFLDILASSLDAKQLQTMKSYFSMVFSKSKSAKVLEAANPISEFEYKIDDRIKTLSTRFNLIEQTGSGPAIIGIIQDITKEKEFEKELQSQKEAQEQEMKDLFDVIQIDPLVFQDFIEDMESNFNYINAILKDKSMTERQVVTKFFQNIHAIKSNALILGLENFGKKLHKLEDDIKAVLGKEIINVDDILSLAIKLEVLMQEKDSYISLISKIEAFRSSNKIDSIFMYSVKKAVERICEETQKKVEIMARQMDLNILTSNLRKPIKDILFQCIRNSVYHGIEPVEERIRKQKKPQGHLVFSIRQIDNKVEVLFSDDGSGLDWEKIKRKYQEKNPDAHEISRNILLSSIFSPEFSTSGETTIVAGRGVGLSLVKDLVTENHGTIQIASSESGLTFKFSFPQAG